MGTEALTQKVNLLAEQNEPPQALSLTMQPVSEQKPASHGADQQDLSKSFVVKGTK